MGLEADMPSSTHMGHIQRVLVGPGATESEGISLHGVLCHAGKGVGEGVKGELVGGVVRAPS